MSTPSLAHPADSARQLLRHTLATLAYRMDETLHASTEKLFQGPVADALTHIGQIAILRRVAGAPVRAGNYYVAKIATGAVGPEQPPPIREF